MGTRVGLAGGRHAVAGSVWCSGDLLGCAEYSVGAVGALSYSHALVSGDELPSGCIKLPEGE
jgi:hypothetical protein